MTSAESLNSLGAEFHLRGDLAAAAIHYNAALRHDPCYLPTVLNLVDILSRQNKLSSAAIVIARATNIAPQNAMIWSNYGNILTRLERYSEARIALDRSAVLAPESVQAWHNLLLLNLREKQIQKALECYQKIVDLGGDSRIVQNDVAHTYLSMGDLDRGLSFYESRWHTLRHLEPWDLHLPEWQGESLDGKRLLLHAEQGYGDTIMTMRFIFCLLDRGAKVTFGVLPGMQGLVEAQNWPIEVVPLNQIDETWASKLDLHSPLYSAMRWLGIQKDDIDPKPYLKAPDIMVPQVFRNAFNVGICWTSGSRGDELDWRRRVSPLKEWLKLGEIPGVQLWSLCPGREAQNEIISLGAESLVIDYVSSFSDFAETASFISQLDLVISVDTAVAHLSGAIGKPTWMLSQFTPCWRWWDLENGTGLPWYETMETQVQQEPGDWKSELDFCAKLLQARVKSWATGLERAA